MNTKQILNRFEDLVSHYRQQLEPLTMERLTRKPSAGEWSLGQVYQHLIQGTLYLHLRNIELCREQASPAGQGVGKTEAGSAVFAQGAFPPIRIQVPASMEYTPGQPESKEQLLEGLESVLRRMREAEQTLADIPDNRTVAHPRFGSLNAKEWFQLIEMHYRHHLMQKERLLEFLSAG